MPFLFEPGREEIFRFTILCDDQEDDGIPDFGFQEVKPEEDWKRYTLHDSWSRGGEGNQLGPEPSAGGDDGTVNCSAPRAGGRSPKCTCPLSSTQRKTSVASAGASSTSSRVCVYVCVYKRCQRIKYNELQVIEL